MTFTGVGVGGGMVIGPVAKSYDRPRVPVHTDVNVRPDGAPLIEDHHADPASIAPAFAAVAERMQAKAALVRIEEGLTRTSGGELWLVGTSTVADILAATAQMARDPVLIAEAERRVAAGESPAEAVDRAVQHFADIFTAAGGELAERVIDLHSVRDRVVAHLMGLPEPGTPVLSQPSVIVATDLSPADTAALDTSKVLAIVTSHGGPTGHTAIIAAQLGIPCVVRASGVMQAVADGDQISVDAATGRVIVHPGSDLQQEATRRQLIHDELAQDTAPGATADGEAVVLLANIGTPEDADRVALTAAEGVGLFRTEVLYLDKATVPTMDEQVAAYAHVFAAFADRDSSAERRVIQPGCEYVGRKVTIRTLDAGADKPLPFLPQTFEENPALGVRGFRLARREPDLLRTQLAAIAQAAANVGAEPWVMAPMISTPDEAKQFADYCAEAGLGRGASFPAHMQQPGRLCPAMVGVMVEVPSAALWAEEILDHVDFVSIGTNDLAQYTMAADRLRGTLVDMLDPFEPPVLELVARVAKAGALTKKPLGVCGESAGDPLMALVLVGLGIAGLSMAPGAMPAVRYALRRTTLATCQDMAKAALAARTAQAAREAVRALADPDMIEALAL
ncbi:MAG: phosphoenolpyruvate--protein phosphotransferase [Cellulomonadaceae bacterium]|nr:phosphoenolpyruvate--protein phosphotransferase [Cellulomonadaceae bacterium]